MCKLAKKNFNAKFITRMDDIENGEELDKISSRLHHKKRVIIKGFQVLLNLIFKFKVITVSDSYGFICTETAIRSKFNSVLQTDKDDVLYGFSAFNLEDRVGVFILNILRFEFPDI